MMQRLSDAMRHGYVQYQAGQVPAASALGLAAKFDALYAVSATERQRRYRKANGLANSRFMIYPLADGTGFQWWLLASEGRGVVHSREKLRNGLDPRDRLQWLDWYELIQAPRQGSKAAWTWRMTRREHEAWQQQIRDALRNQPTDDLLRQAMWSLSRVPGFAGLRDQVADLYKLTHAEIKRSRRGVESGALVPEFIGYVQRVTSPTFALSYVAMRLSKKRPAFPRSRDSTTGSRSLNHSDSVAMADPDVIDHGTEP
ncbi:MAG TPA: hypothetical protein VGU69_10360 [Rhizomicrobium sp.]|nr:hypothetical protein [Rhizomicrobium sp.]